MVQYRTFFHFVMQNNQNNNASIIKSHFRTSISGIKRNNLYLKVCKCFHDGNDIFNILATLHRFTADHFVMRVRSYIRSLSDEVNCNRISAVLYLRKLDFAEHQKVLQPYSAM